MRRKLPQDDIVISLYLSGASTGEIAEKFGVKPITVLSLLRSRGVPRRSAKEAAYLAKESGRWSPTKYWLGKEQPPDMVERRVSKIRGENHWLWKGGKDRRLYRDLVRKVECARCGSKLNLSLHHVNFDHYDDRPDNLQVLCVSCHMSTHKKAYWDAVHSGVQPPKSNGRVGWRKGGDAKSGSDIPSGE